MVSIEQIVAVSGQPGLYKLISSRSNGLVLEDLTNGKTNFYSSRNSEFAPLESMGIYTLGETIALKDVYEKFVEFEKNTKIPSHDESDNVIKEFFQIALPEHDPYRVRPRDMKKCLKWYHQLKSHQLIVPEDNTSNPPEKTD